MKRYTTADESAGFNPNLVDKNLSLQAVCEITDWCEEDFDKISEMEVGEKLDFQGITVERTK